MIDTKLLLDTTRELHVLYVEDDEELSNVTKDLLSIYFNTIEVAYDGEEGFEKYNTYYDKNKTYYDIVITDINMPQMNGIEMSKCILQKNETQAIIVITAYNSADYLKEAIDLGVDGFISKPMDSDQLFRTIFKVSKIICDQKIIDIYIQEIEELNFSLEEKNSALFIKNQELEKSFRMLDTVINKDEIIKTSKKQSPVKEQKNDINNDIKDQVLDLVHDDLPELKDILTDIDVSIINIINNLDDIHAQDIVFLIKNFSRYAAILNYYTFFHELSLAMVNFVNTMKKEPLPKGDDGLRNVFTFLETFVYVLVKWQNDISGGDESKINQLDASIISDINTISNMWIQKEEEVNEGDLDDIFDF